MLKSYQSYCNCQILTSTSKLWKLEQVGKCYYSESFTIADLVHDDDFLKKVPRNKKNTDVSHQPDHHSRILKTKN